MWHALVPLKRGSQVKSRLSGFLALDERLALAEAMATHVLSVLQSVPCIERIDVFSSSPWPDCDIGWKIDRGGDLNSELQAVRGGALDENLLVLHGDLPGLTRDDVEALCACANRNGRIALAPDRYGRGTNAVAMAALAPFRFCFGDDSLERHIAAAGTGVTLVHRRGLSHDIDTIDEFRASSRVSDMMKGKYHDT